MKFIYLILNWFFGITFFLFSLATMVLYSFLSGLCYLSISLLLLPPVREFIYSQTKLSIGFKMRVLVIFVLSMSSVYFQGKAMTEKREALAREQAKERVAKINKMHTQYFNEHRDSVIKSIEQALKQQEYELAVSESSKYLITNDKVVRQLNTTARNALAEKQRKEEEKRKQQEAQKILAELKTIPVSDYLENRDLYKKLVDYYPDNKKYREKYQFYAQQWDRQIHETKLRLKAKEEKR